MKNLIVALAALTIFVMPAWAADLGAATGWKPTPPIVQPDLSVVEEEKPHVSPRIFYFGGSLGYSRSSDIDVGGDLISLSSNGSALIAAQAGVRLSRHWRAEIEFSHQSLDYDGSINQRCCVEVAVKSEVRRLGIDVSADSRVNRLMVNGFYDFPSLDMGSGSKIVPYVGAGAGLAFISTDVDLTDGESTLSASNDDTVFTGQLMAGINIPITQRTDMRVGYRYQFTKSPDFEGLDIDNIHSHVAEVGVAFKF